MEKIINFKCLNMNANVKLDFRKKEVFIQQGKKDLSQQKKCRDSGKN